MPDQYETNTVAKGNKSTKGNANSIPITFSNINVISGIPTETTNGAAIKLNIAQGSGKDISIPSNLYDPQNDSKYSIGTQNILVDLTLRWYASTDESSKNAVLTMINITRNDANDHYVKEAMEKFTDNLLNGNFGGGLLTEPILQWAGISESVLNEKSDNIFIAQLGTINPFKGKSAQEIDRMFREKGFKAEGVDPANGKGGYVNPKTGRSYYIDEGGQYKKGFEAPHVDINRDSFKGNKFKLPKLKFFR